MVQTEQKEMQIKQIQTSDSVIFFHEIMAKKYNLKEYRNKRRPLLYMGCYKKEDVHIITNHKGFILLLWLGTDALRLTPQRAKLLDKPNIHHIAQCEYIARDLDKVGLKYTRINVAITNHKLNPQPLGDHVYFYYGRNNPEFYGYSRVVRIREKLRDVKFIFGTIGEFKLSEMPKVYKDSFIGLRLTPHDGLSETVLEMGMMGRRCVWNEPFPGCYQWKTDQDIIDAIYKEKEKIGQINHELVKEVVNYMDVGDWLNTDYYEKKR